MRKVAIVFVAAVLLLLAVNYVLAADEKAEGKPQTTCPIMGGKIDKAIFVDYEGKRVYFCCKACPEKFLKEPAKYIKKMEDAGIVLEKAPAKAK